MREVVELTEAGIEELFRNLQIGDHLEIRSNEDRIEIFEAIRPNRTRTTVFKQIKHSLRGRDLSDLCYEYKECALIMTFLPVTANTSRLTLKVQTPGRERSSSFCSYEHIAEIVLVTSN